VCSDAEWMLELAERAREATSRSAANQALNNCWELFSRVTGPAYAGGAEASPWAWVDERDDQLGGPTPSERATTTLLDAVRVAVETWDALAASGLDDLRSPTVLVQILLRLQRALGLAEPWPLFQAADLPRRQAMRATRTTGPWWNTRHPTTTADELGPVERGQR
jgi:hypothetical protein